MKRGGGIPVQTGQEWGILGGGGGGGQGLLRRDGRWSFFCAWKWASLDSEEGGEGRTRRAIEGKEKMGLDDQQFFPFPLLFCVYTVPIPWLQGA